MDIRTLGPVSAPTNAVIMGGASNAASQPALYSSTGSNNVVLSDSPTFAGVVSLKALKQSYNAQITNYAITANDYYIHCTSNTFTVTLPSAAAVGSGSTYVVKNSGVGTITIETTSSQTIDGSPGPGTTGFSITSKVSYTYVSDGSNWFLI